MSGKTTPGKSGQCSGRDLVGLAQDLVNSAWETADPINRTILARKALRISADCADAYVLLAEAATTLPEALEFYRQGVEAGRVPLAKSPSKTMSVISGESWKPDLICEHERD